MADRRSSLAFRSIRFDPVLARLLEKMELALALLAGVLLGGLAVAALCQRRHRTQSAALSEAERRSSIAEAQCAVEQRNAEHAQERMDEQAAQHREQLRKLSDELGEKFRLHADAALKHQEEAFLKRAGKQFEPFEQELGKLREYTLLVEKQRHQDKGELEKQLSILSQATQDLRGQSESLATALRGSSKARGDWGETSLRNLVELAGMSEFCDFSEQQVAADGLRPDMVIRLPGGELIPVDVKVALSDYLDAVDAEDEQQRSASLQAHGKRVRERARELSRKSYADQLEGHIDYVVMFLPGEQFLDAAMRVDKNLLVEAAQNRVLIATPVTFLALLKTVQLIWRNETAAENAREILDVAQELHRRASKFGEHLDSVGRALATTVGAYDKTRASYEKRLLPMGSRLGKLSVSEEQGQQMPRPRAVEGPASS